MSKLHSNQSVISPKDLSRLILDDFEKYRKRYYKIEYGGELTKELDRELIEYVVKWITKRRNGNQ